MLCQSSHLHTRTHTHTHRMWHTGQEARTTLLDHFDVVVIVEERDALVSFQSPLGLPRVRLFARAEAFYKGKQRWG